MEGKIEINVQHEEGHDITVYWSLFVPTVGMTIEIEHTKYKVLNVEPNIFTSKTGEILDYIDMKVGDIDVKA